MSILGKIKSLIGLTPRGENNEGTPESVFVYVKIPEDILPLKRCEKYEDPLDEVLKPNGLGEVSGGGSQLGKPHSDGSASIEFCGIDIDGPTLEPILAVLRGTLPTLGVPEGTEIHYTSGDQRLQDVFEDGSWSVGHPRTFLHPGFGC